MSNAQKIKLAQNEDKNYSVLIDCPEHLTHKVSLFTRGHRYAGIWECNKSNEGISDSCPHFDAEEQEDEDYEGNKFKLFVCILCGVEVKGGTND